MGTLEDVKRAYSFWGKRSGLYSIGSHVTFLGRERTIRSRAVEKLSLKKGDEVLEIACGTGKDFPFLVEALGKEGKVIGFDYTEAMLDAARSLCKREGWTNIELIQGDAAELSLGDRRFDGVLCILGMSAIPRFKEALRRAREVLKESGRISICDANIFKGPLKIFNPLVRFAYRRTAIWDETRDIISEVENLFEDVEVETFNADSIYIVSGGQSSQGGN